MNRKQISVGLAILFFAAIVINDASALTPPINRYVASKALPEQVSQCEEKLFEGVLAPSKSANWEANPDFKPQNWECYSNESDCPAKTIAEKYLQIGLEETDPCKKAFNLGIYSTFWSHSQTPTNWINVTPECQTDFEQEIQENVTQFKQDWEVKHYCQLRGEEGKINLSFSAYDLNSLILQISEKAEKKLKDINQSIKIPIPIEDKDNIYELIIDIIENNPEAISNDPEKLNTKTLLELFDYSCPLSTQRQLEIYDKWKQLDYTAKECLPVFLSQQTSNAYTLASSCYNLGAGTQTIYNQQSLSSAQYYLSQYSRLGFGETKCRKISMPTIYPTMPMQGLDQITLQQNSGIPQSNSFEYEICETVPKKIPKGCMQVFNQWERMVGDAWTDGASTAVTFMIFIIVMGLVVMYVYWTKGD